MVVDDRVRLALSACEATYAPISESATRFNGYALREAEGILSVDKVNFGIVATTADCDGGQLVVALRGTYNAANIRQDLDFGIVDIRQDLDFGIVELRERKLVGAHSGFHDALQALLKVDLLVKVRRAANKRQRLLLTGHSLGGAMATLLALELLECTSLQVDLVTFGQPPAGDSVLATVLREHTSGASPRLSMRRFALTMDPVPHCFHLCRAAAAGFVGKEMAKRFAVFEHATDLLALDSAVASSSYVFLRVAERAAACILSPDARRRIAAVQGAAIALFEHHLLTAYREAIESSTKEAVLRSFKIACTLACSLRLDASAKLMLGQVLGAPSQRSGPLSAKLQQILQQTEGNALTLGAAGFGANVAALAVGVLNLGMSAFILVRFDGRFDALEKRVGGRFDALEQHVDGRFDALEQHVDGRFDALGKHVDGRFDALGRRFDALEKIIDISFNALGE